MSCRPASGQGLVICSYQRPDGTVTVVADQSEPLDFELARENGQTSTDEGKTLVLDKCEVLSDREESVQQRAMNQRRLSPNIKNVVAFDEYPTAGEPVPAWNF